MEIDDEPEPAIAPLSRPIKNTAAHMNVKTLSTKHRQKRNRKKRKGQPVTTEQLERDRKTREIRDNKAHRRLAAKIRGTIADSPGSKMLNCFGSWVPRNSPIRGHARRGSGKLKKAMDSVDGDCVAVADEYLSSSVCPYCFRRLQTHLYHRKGKRKKCNGAKICYNPACPSRTSHSTTMNRDAVGSHNIAVCTISTLIAKDGKVLPPFRRGATPTNQPKTYLVTNYQTAIAPLGSPSHH